jgi:hypothetical protein
MFSNPCDACCMSYWNSLSIGGGAHVHRLMGRRSAIHDKECKLQENFFPAFISSGNACSCVELSTSTATPNGCGCSKPSESAPCTTYDPSVALLLSNADESCFICTIMDLVNELCPYCKMCFASKNSCINDIPTTMLVMNPESSYILYIHHAAWI